MDTINLAQDRVRWQGLVNVGSRTCREFLDFAEDLLASQENHCSVEVVNYLESSFI
jgi:hypothetical protein